MLIIVIFKNYHQKMGPIIFLALGDSRFKYDYSIVEGVGSIREGVLKSIYAASANTLRF